MALGSQLKDARIRQHLTMSEVAKATRMKIQMIDDLEHENFSKIAAPIYGKGFIRLYAELVGLDPNPLINEYLSSFSEYRKATLDVEDMSEHSTHEHSTHEHTAHTPAMKSEPEETKPSPDLFDHMAVPVEESAKQASGSPHSPRPAQKLSSIRDVLYKLFGEMLEQALSFISRLGKAAYKSIPPRLLDAAAIGSKTHKISVAVLLLILLVFIISSLSRCSGSRSEDTPQTSSKTPIQIAVQPPATYVE